MLPACINSTTGLWFPSCGESGLIYYVSPQHPAECRHSAEAGLSMKLKMPSLLKWRSSSAPGHGGLVVQTLILARGWAGPQCPPGSKPGNWPCPRQVVGRGKGQNGIYQDTVCSPHGSLFPHGTCRAVGVPVSMLKGMPTVSLWRTGDLENTVSSTLVALNLVHDPLWSAHHRLQSSQWN